MNTPTRTLQSGAPYAAEREIDRGDMSEVLEIGGGFREVVNERGFSATEAELQNQ